MLHKGFLLDSRRRSRSHLKHYRPPPSSSAKLASTAGATLPGDSGPVAGYDAYLSVKLPGAHRTHDTLQPGLLSQQRSRETYESEDNEYAYVDEFQFPVATGNCSQGQRANESAHPYGLLSRPACELGAECVGSCMHENSMTQHDVNSRSHQQWHHHVHLPQHQSYQQQPEQSYYEGRDGRASSLPRDLIRKC